MSESLYAPLRTLEVALRNRIYTVLTQAKGEAWYGRGAGALKVAHQLEQVAKAVNELVRAGKTVTAGGVVASLTFSFWTTMFNKDYEALWQQILHRIADPSAPRGLKRRSFSGPLTRIRVLRNRIAHHEPIRGWNLRGHHDEILTLIEWLSPPAATWCRENNRFPQAYPEDGITLVCSPESNRR
ncbi:hypothetical protein K7565_18905 [Stenotrophomonas maltophilia]|nr:hypothetical protein K7565_18905 [Stenotrophomonas maltophilia]